MPARSEVGDNTPLRLAVAAVLAYPNGSMTASGLRREAARGRLVIERTASDASGCSGRAGTANNSRARAMLAARLPLASSP